MSIKVGVIGVGGMLQYHAAGFRQAGAEIVAVCDAAPGAAAKAATKWGITTPYETVEAMLSRPEVDAVSVIVPNKFHKSLTIQCLEAGKHVFCEKPPALNAGEVKEIIAAGHSVGNHTYDHVNVKATKAAEIQHRFQRAPWLIEGQAPAEVIRENIRLASAAITFASGS